MCVCVCAYVRVCMRPAADVRQHLCALSGLGAYTGRDRMYSDQPGGVCCEIKDAAIRHAPQRARQRDKQHLCV